MARLLVWGGGAGRNTFENGHVVAIVPDGHVFGSGEGFPLFYTVDVPGATVEELSALAEPQYAADGKTMVRVRRFRHTTGRQFADDALKDVLSLMNDAAFLRTRRG